MDQDSIQLLARYRDGDSEAADELFHRYVDRLVGLARTRLSDRLAQRVDPEDVVQSVYRTFFSNAREGRYVLERTGDMWRLLAAITINKVLGQAKHHRRDKRSIDREQRLEQNGNESRNSAELFAESPALPDAIAVIDELESLMAELDPLSRRILELRLQGISVEEVATEVSRSERTIRRALVKIKGLLEQRLLEASIY